MIPDRFVTEYPARCIALLDEMEPIARDKDIRNAIWTVSDTPQPLAEARLPSERVLEDMIVRALPKLEIC